MNSRFLKPDKPDLLVFDCDPGCDDALAIALVLSDCPYQRVDFLTVAGNVSVEQTTTNAQRLLSLLKSYRYANNVELKLYPGCRTSLTGGELLASNVHGRDGLGDVPRSFIEPTCDPHKLEEHHAVDRLRKLGKGNRKFDLLCTGPLTNIATALVLMNAKQQLKFWQNARRIVFMGGNFSVSGNITPAAEFNVFHDPVAVQLVLDSWNASNSVLDSRKGRYSKKTPQLSTIKFVPLDATEKVAFDLGNLNSPTTGTGMFLQSALTMYARFHALACSHPDWEKKDYQKRDIDVFRNQLVGGSGIKKWEPFFYVHDALAAWVMLNSWDTRRWSEQRIRVDTSRGDSRGHIFMADPKARPFSTAPPAIGTRIQWLQPINEAENNKLKNRLKKILEG